MKEQLIPVESSFEIVLIFRSIHNYIKLSVID